MIQADLTNSGVQEVNLKEGHDNWYLDTSASSYMMGDKSVFQNLDETVRGNVRFGDGSMVRIEGQGVVLSKSPSGNHQALTMFYYVPSL